MAAVNGTSLAPAGLMPSSSLPIIWGPSCPCGCCNAADVTYRRGSFLYRAGEPANRVFFLRRGAVVLTREHPEGGEAARAARKKASFVGLEALVRPAYHDNCRVVSTSIVCAVDRAAFDAWLGPSEGPVRLAFMQLLAESLSEPPAVATRDGGATARVARWLVSHAPDGDARVPRRYTAGLLGMVPETLSRVLSRLAAEGLVEVGRRGVHVVDLPGLRRRAGLPLLDEAADTCGGDDDEHPCGCKHGHAHGGRPTVAA